MTFMKNCGMIRQEALTLLLLGSLTGLGLAQHNKSTPSAPHVSAPHASAPARPAANRPSNSTMNRPSAGGARPNGSTGTRYGNGAGTRTGTAGTRSGTGIGNRNQPMGRNTGTRTPGTGTMGRNGTGTMRGTGTTFNRGGGMNHGTGTMSRASSHPLPGRQVSLKGGGMASIRPNGQIRSINRNGMQISHGLNGSRHIESMHNGARVVTTGKNSGYVQRNYVVRNGQTYVSRTTVVNNVSYTTVYRSYSYGGYCCYYGYNPGYYYGPAYYGWAYNPWPAPVYYGWGWGGAPWYGYYGGYFAPYPTYPSAAFWITDYLIAANLQAAYAARAAAANSAAGDAGGGGGQQGGQQSENDNSASNSGAVQLSPEVKQAIADEVKAQLAAEQAAAQGQGSSGGSSGGSQASSSGASQSQDVPPALDPAKRTFVVASDMTVNADGQECQLTSGDVITRLSDSPDSNRNVDVSVAASKKSDCAVGKQVAVSVDDLQEMYNHFQEQIDNGMKDLANKQGSNGIPKAPETTTKPSDVPPPPPDNSAAKTLEEQQTQADQAEAQVVKEAFSQGS